MTITPLDRLTQLLAKLPGLGPRSARRVVLHLLKRREALLLPLVDALQQTAAQMRFCSACGNLDVTDPCTICDDPRRDRSRICVVEDVADLWAIERSQAFRGLYHVLGGTLSALDGVRPDDLRIGVLGERVGAGDVTEVILALNATVDGQTTAHYVAERLGNFPVAISRLAHGLPVGGQLDYLDDGTLTAALLARRQA
ncbi:MAG: recombination protein RecR [Alphaproteobacteria bacterium]|nr:recombination protein RecR [Alphaproteobacteria bacterium]